MVNLLNLKRRNKKLYERIIKAAAIFFESYYNDPNNSVNSRILLQASSFESLLNLSEGRGRADFKDIIRVNYFRSDSSLWRYSSERSNGQKATESEGVHVMWGDKFFTLRNHIIHGSNVKQREFNFMNKQRHTDIAAIFFISLVKRLINKKFGRTVFSDLIGWKRYSDGDLKFEGFSYEDYSYFTQLQRRTSGKSARIPTR